jgi:hypothetical protein
MNTDPERNRAATPLWLLLAVVTLAAAYFVWRDIESRRPPDTWKQLGEEMRRAQTEERTRKLLEGR